MESQMKQIRIKLERRNKAVELKEQDNVRQLLREKREEVLVNRRKKEVKDRVIQKTINKQERDQ